MYGGTSKMGGRGGGRGGGGGGGGAKRRFSPFLPQSSNRPAATTKSRPSVGGGPNPRNRSGPTASTSAVAAEETFSLVPGNNPLAFAMIIRLAPDLVDEIRKVEAQGETARIKFDSTTNNPNGNVIDVGGKEFRFTWSREFDDLCDIYEERQSGEDGNGLLVESGCAWRKVNVQRILDESTKNHVKMRSEEAERKLKSRKAIVLDHENPSMKSQLEKLAAVESNPRRSFKQKKEPPFKKRKVETPQDGLPLKSKDNAASSEKEILAKANNAAQEMPARKGNVGSKPMDLQNLLISLLMENPKGMSLKALEKAVGDTIPNSAKKIEPIIKKIATLQAPGRYFLKPGVELESFKKPSSDSGSSPEETRQQTLVPADGHDQTTALGPGFVEKSSAAVLAEQSQLDSKHEEKSNTLGKIDIQQQSPDLFGDKKVFDNSEGQAGSSSNSGSDSDSESDSSDSGSDSGSHSRSRSRSKSRSPVESGSRSSSDSESDSSSNSKEGSDVDVDVDIIISDDDKRPQHKSPASVPGFSVSPDPWRSVQNETDEKQNADGSDAVGIEGNGSAAIDTEGNGSGALDVEVHESVAVDIEKGLANDEKEIEMVANRHFVSSKGAEELAGAKLFSSDHDLILERQTFIGNLFDDDENMVKESTRHEHSDSSERTSKSKLRRDPDRKHLGEKFERTKRLKAESFAEVPVLAGRDNQFPESPHNRHIEDAYKGPAINTADRELNADFGSQRGYNQAFPGKPNSNFQQSGRRSTDQNARAKGPDIPASRSKYAENSGHRRKYAPKDLHLQEGFPMQREKASTDTQNENNFAKVKKGPRNPKEGGAGSRNSAPFDSHYRKQGEMLGKLKDDAHVSNLQMGSSPRDNNTVNMHKYPVAGGRGLQRELSDMELGELREPLSEEIPVKKQCERKASFKQSDNKPSTSDNCNSDLGKGKHLGKATLDSGKPSPNPSASAKGTPEHHVEDLARSHHKVTQAHPQQLSRGGNEAGVKPGISTEGYGESHKKAMVNAQQLHDSKSGLLPHTIKENKTPASNTTDGIIDGRKDFIFTEGNSNARKRRESSLEEDDSSYSKYEKDVPELKGPVKDFSQYKEYVQEFRDKYESYCSLNKILESCRNDFQKLGKDLEFAKGRDMDRYHKTLAHLRESYRQCGPRHKRLKKIFAVLHEELEHLKQRIKDYANSYAKD